MLHVSTQRIDARGEGIQVWGKKRFHFYQAHIPGLSAMAFCVPLLWINDGDAFFHLLRVHLRNKLAKFLCPVPGFSFIPVIFRRTVPPLLSIYRHLDHRLSRLVFRWMGPDSALISVEGLAFGWSTYLILRWVGFIKSFAFRCKIKVNSNFLFLASAIIMKIGRSLSNSHFSVSLGPFL